MSKKTQTKKITSIGGSALIEGIMMRGPKRITVAVRTGEDSIYTEDVSIKFLGQSSKFWKLPFFRGVAGMIDSMRLSYKSLMLSADKALEAGEVEEEEPSKFEKWVDEKLGDKFMKILMVFSTLIGVALAILLFFFLPTWIFNLIGLAVPDIRKGGEVVVFWQSVAEGLLKIVIFLAYILIVSQMRDMKRVFQYHGAEHKAIFCYENELPLTVENVKKQRRFHPRCELIKFCGKHDNRLTRIIAAPGLWAQRITTKEPSEDMCEVAIEAISAVIPDDGSDIVKDGCCN